MITHRTDRFGVDCGVEAALFGFRPLRDHSRLWPAEKNFSVSEGYPLRS